MSKKDKLEREKFRRSVAKTYSDRLQELQNENRRLMKANMETRDKLEEAEDEVRKLRDWNERLLEFMDMTEEEFEILKLRLSRESVLSDVNITSGMSKVIGYNFSQMIHHLL